MLVKLSDNRYINPDRISQIEPIAYPNEGSSFRWVVWFSSNDSARLTQAQFDELMDCLPSPVTSKTYRKGA